MRTKTAAEPQADCSGKWEASTPETVKNFSAVAYFFAADLRREQRVLFSAAAPNPVAVRYGWANSPRCNLYNQEGLPASPFRTDDWNK